MIYSDELFYSKGGSGAWYRKGIVKSDLGPANPKLENGAIVIQQKIRHETLPNVVTMITVVLEPDDIEQIKKLIL